MSPRARRDRPRQGWRAGDDAVDARQARPVASSPSVADRHRTDVPWPGHDPHASGCTDYAAGADLGELAPGHRLLVRGACLDGQWLSLYYAWTPGLTQPMGEESGVWLAVDYGADVSPTDLSAIGSYGIDGGEFSEGNIKYTRPPASAGRAWFDFYATSDDHHRACRLTIDLEARRGPMLLSTVRQPNGCLIWSPARSAECGPPRINSREPITNEQPNGSSGT
jgi:hypothetical protein